MMEYEMLFLLMVVSLVIGVVMIKHDHSDRFGYIVILGTLSNIIIVMVCRVYEVLSGISGGW